MGTNCFRWDVRVRVTLNNWNLNRPKLPGISQLHPPKPSLHTHSCDIQAPFIHGFPSLRQSSARQLRWNNRKTQRLVHKLRELCGAVTFCVETHVCICSSLPIHRMPWNSRHDRHIILIYQIFANIRSIRSLGTRNIQALNSNRTFLVLISYYFFDFVTVPAQEMEKNHLYNKVKWLVVSKVS